MVPLFYMKIFECTPLWVKPDHFKLLNGIKILTKIRLCIIIAIHLRIFCTTLLIQLYIYIDINDKSFDFSCYLSVSGQLHVLKMGAQCMLKSTYGRGIALCVNWAAHVVMGERGGVPRPRGVLLDVCNISSELL